MTKKTKPVVIDFNPEFQRVLALMEDTQKNILITGRAGKRWSIPLFANWS